jgi:two-component system chemotaxis response regulator CheB
MALLKALQMGLLKKGQPFPQVTLPCLRQAAAAPPPFLAVVLAASTGGPETVEDVILNLPPAATEDVCFFLALHGPAWMLSTYATHLRARTGWDVRLAEDGEAFQPGRLYIAPGDRHLEVAGPTPRARLTQDPPENFVRPSADPLLRTVARVFGPHAIVAVLTGVGCDGTMGAAHIAAACGTILVQSPETSVVAQMPAAVLRAGLSRQKVARHQMGAALGRVIQERRSAWRASVSPSS